jgi:hypothetical protein
MVVFVVGNACERDKGRRMVQEEVALTVGAVVDREQRTL